MGSVQIFRRLRVRLAQFTSGEIAQRALAKAAPRIQAKLREDATTKRGNVPGYGEMGGPITVTAQSTGITVRAPDWVMNKAYDLAQPEEWNAILGEEIRRSVEAP